MHERNNKAIGPFDSLNVEVVEGIIAEEVCVGRIFRERVAEGRQVFYLGIHPSEHNGSAIVSLRIQTLSLTSVALV